jgi:hypothetical protein
MLFTVHNINLRLTFFATCRECPMGERCCPPFSYLVLVILAGCSNLKHDYHSQLTQAPFQCTLSPLYPGPLLLGMDQCSAFHCICYKLLTHLNITHQENPMGERGGIHLSPFLAFLIQTWGVEGVMPTYLFLTP